MKVRVRIAPMLRNSPISTVSMILFSLLGQHALIYSPTGLDCGQRVAEPGIGEHQACRCFRHVGCIGHRNSDFRLLQRRGKISGVIRDIAPVRDLIEAIISDAAALAEKPHALAGRGLGSLAAFDWSARGLPAVETAAHVSDRLQSHLLKGLR